MNEIEKREKNRLKNILWRKNNKEKYLRSAANYRAKHPEKLKEYKLQTRYKISQEDYDLMLSKQDNKCGICGNFETATHNKTKQIQKLAVDHCHITGRVRGLLCQACNRGIAKFHDNILNLANAIKYLSK